MSFSLDISRWIEKAKGNADKVTRAAAVLAAQGVVQMSPVDTGRFRGNWQLGIGSVNADTSSPVDPGGAQVLGRIQAQVAQASAGDVLWVSNSLPYAQRLEMGWSKQAPSGMVRVTMADLPARIEAYASTLA